MVQQQRLFVIYCQVDLSHFSSRDYGYLFICLTSEKVKMTHVIVTHFTRTHTHTQRDREIFIYPGNSFFFFRTRSFTIRSHSSCLVWVSI